METTENLYRILATIPKGVKLVAVSKYRPLEQLQECYDAGQRDFAESRPLEFEAKAKAMPDDVRWHFIGHLQTNKLKHVLPCSPLIHSIDSERLVEAMENFASGHGLAVNGLVEVHIGQEDSKGGFAPDEVESFIRRRIVTGDFPHVHIYGLMGMASNTADTARIESEFTALKALFDRMRASFPQLTDFRELSMGMSADYEIALRHGATLVRIGSAIFNP